MSVKNLKRYIDCINNREPINLQGFINAIQKLSLSSPYHPEDISARKVKGNKYLVDHIREGLINELRLLVNDIGWDRTSAARQNNSHDEKVDGSLLIVREGSAHPKVLVIDSNGCFYGIDKPSRRALLIENRQNFIFIEKTLAFLINETSFLTDPSFDVIFAAGNEISNSLHYKFLEQYEHLYLFFDLDLGGLTTARNLNTLLPEMPTEFIVPKNIVSRLSKIVEEVPTQYIEKVINIGLADPMLAPFAKLIKDHQRVLEQESYLYDG